ncbi:outer membrane protein OmpA-like peptidoglycan-associated protein [Pelomonas saccharophila]|uniref:Outer membrane protein OmpA-like peptidoglycan-associated protein n=1 Tax=Roseateles saccharophilus TaxID=304 RepID=A0ABU1YPS4_ROSSA|nr:OmpA family protein [Roseateles saccharophilus]MDR7270865.1 outer membrane protein OmpA-like peptidoglycan-associated protein [Roseateles saccharophilus]
MKITARLTAALLAVVAHASAMAADPPSYGDLPGAADHALIKRFAGSWLAGQRTSNWDAAAMPSSVELSKSDKRQFKDTPLNLEGKVTQTVYIAPRGKSNLEVWRNYEQALNAAGFKKRFACERDCFDLYFAWLKLSDPMKGMVWAKGYVETPSSGRYSLGSALSGDEGRMLVGTLGKPGQEATVLIYNSLAANATTGLVATYVQVVEPKPMETGQVTVDPNALQAGLVAEGRVTLTGLFFDTGKTELKPESKAQLEAMAELLKNQPTLKAWIVGHTDNVGGFDANQTLSMERARAVVLALTAAPYKVDPKRLSAKGLASLAPVAGNGDEAGRARNRRVELVAQ